MAESSNLETMPRSYTYLWKGFLSWCEVSGRESLPADVADVAAYLQERSSEGARPSTIRVIAAAIAFGHTASGFSNPSESPPVQEMLAVLAQGDTSSQPRVLPLDMDAYLAIRDRAYAPRTGGTGRMESVDVAMRRGAFDLAIIALMRDARLKVREACALTWRDVQEGEDGSGWVTVRALYQSDSTGVRFLSPDTMRLLLAMRQDGGDDDRIVGLRPNQVGLRIRDAAIRAGLGPGYSGESPRMGMAQDLETLGVRLLGKFASGA